MSPADLEKKLKKARDLMRSRNHAPALQLYALMAQQFPEGLGEYGSAVAESGDFDLAVRLWERYRRFASKNGAALGWTAGECGKVGLNVLARTLWIEAADAEPRNLELQVALAAFLAKTGGVEEARPAVCRCLELDPANDEARYLSAHLDRRENKLEDAERQLRALLASDLKGLQARYSCYAELAYILDRTERFDEAMTVLEEGKRFARQTALDLTASQKSAREDLEKRSARTKSFPRNILQLWNKTFPPSARNVLPPAAFLCGVARSGTTLLERVMDAHPAVAACDEAMALDKLQPRIDLAAASVPAQRLNVLRELYFKNITTALGAPVIGKTVLDKNPGRTTWLPAFLRLFPELRVLIALRDPRDIMISLYFQDQIYTNYQTLEQHARRYAVIMDAWLAVREWEGLNWMETKYEDIVADLEGQGARVTKFLGLEWHEKQARFFEHNREKPILSNNYSEVTKPVYKRAVGRWRVYEKHLAPALPILEPYCRIFGYD
jgi:tetratricopeptide (TPR) repeat protein